MSSLIELQTRLSNYKQTTLCAGPTIHTISIKPQQATLSHNGNVFRLATILTFLSAQTYCKGDEQDHLPGVTYLSPAAQEALPYRITGLLQWDHLGRKNVGYMYAMHHGAEVSHRQYPCRVHVRPVSTRGGICCSRATDCLELFIMSSVGRFVLREVFERKTILLVVKFKTHGDRLIIGESPLCTHLAFTRWVGTISILI